MALTKLSLPKDNHSELVIQFLAELMQATIEVQDPTAFQQTLQTYCDRLRPWLEPRDGPPNPRAVFSLLENCALDETGEQISVVLSPEAEALFRAWMRRNKMLWDASVFNSHAWSN
jgi:hypothetical protein